MNFLIPIHCSLHIFSGVHLVTTFFGNECCPLLFCSAVCIMNLYLPIHMDMHTHACLSIANIMHKMLYICMYCSYFAFMLEHSLHGYVPREVFPKIRFAYIDTSHA